MGYTTYTCPIAARCGGCELLAVPYPIQLRRKQEHVTQLFSAIAEKDHAAIEPIRGMDVDGLEPRAYRHKAATPFAPGRKGRVRAGFYAAGSHRIVACDSCLVEDPRARAILNGVARVAERLRVPAYQEDRSRGVLRHAIVRCGWRTDDVLLTVVANGERLPREREFVEELRRHCPEVTSAVLNVNQRRTNAMLGATNRTLFGEGVMHDELLGCTFEIGPASFYQTNPAQTETLYGIAIDAVLGVGAAGGTRGSARGAGGSAVRDDLHGNVGGGDGNEMRDGTGTDNTAASDAVVSPHESLHVIDAYCGTGTIGICLAAEAALRGACVEVTGVERTPEAIACARRNARNNGLAERCEFVSDDATHWLKALASQEQRPACDALILDPPRAGSTPQFLEAAARLGSLRIIYVSCNPTTQARDIELLRKRGYRLARVCPVDMFPHTKHVETVALLER